jgi:hypothetical protein
MLASAVEAYGFGDLDVGTQLGIGARGHQSPWEVALVEDQALNVRLAVQKEPSVFRLDLAQPEVAHHVVGVAQPQVELVEVRRFRAPRHDSVERDAAVAGALPAARESAVERHDHVHLAIRNDLDRDGSPFEVWQDAQAPDRARRQRLEPDGLPDPRRRRVEDALGDRFPVLLAAPMVRSDIGSPRVRPECSRPGRRTS